MKIAYISDVIYPYVKGGAEKRIYEVSKRLVEKGYEVHLYGVKWWEGREIIKHDGVTLHGVCSPPKQLYINGRRDISQAISFGYHLLRCPHKSKFDIIDCSQFPYFSIFAAKYLAWKQNTPLIVTWHEVWRDYWYEYLGYKGIFGKNIEKIASKLATFNIAVSNKTKKDLIALGVKESKISVIPNGADLEVIQKIASSGEEYDVIFVGRLIKEKNVDMLIKAIAIAKKAMPNIKIAIIGEGHEKKKLLDLAESLGVKENIKFLGFLEQYEEVISHMKASKVFVLPSSREGFSIAVLEAMACGLPSIAVHSERSSAPELITSENGFLVGLNAEQISEKIVLLLSDEKLRCEMKEKSIKKSREYDWKARVEELESIYSEIML